MAALSIERSRADGSLIDVLDRILDKGIVIDAYVRVSLVGVDLVSVEARVVVASVQTYLMYADSISETPTASRPQPRSSSALPPERPGEDVPIRERTSATAP